MYIAEDRDITIYTLDLDTEGKEAILSYAENKVLPENCYYAYHEFRDNCSTSIRDILDIGTGGQLKETFDAAAGRFSFRQHIRRYTWFRPFSDRYLDFLMGQDLDEPISAWDEMFLPIEIGRNIVDFKYTDAAGLEQKLVRSVEIRGSSKARQPILNQPLRTWPFDLALGALIAVFLLFISRLRKKHPRAGRILLGASQSILGLFFGFAGCVLLFGLFFMSNDYIQQNINMLFINPLLLAAVPLGIMAATGKSFRVNPNKWLHILWTYVFIAGAISLLVKALPMFYQQNQPVQALVLPIALALCFASKKLQKIV
jgi:hypothetical protein